MEWQTICTYNCICDIKSDLQSCINFHNYSSSSWFITERRHRISVKDACDNYTNSVILKIAANMIEIEDTQKKHFFGNGTSRSEIISEWIDRNTISYKNQVNSFIDKFVNNSMELMMPTFRGYNRYMINIYASEWFNFPQRIFNFSSYKNDRTKYKEKDGIRYNGINWNGNLSMQSKKRFATFLGLKGHEKFYHTNFTWNERFGNKKNSFAESYKFTKAFSCANTLEFDRNKAILKIPEMNRSHYNSYRFLYQSQNYPNSVIHNLKTYVIVNSSISHDENISHIHSENIDHLSVSLPFSYVLIIVGVLDSLILIYRGSRTVLAIQDLVFGTRDRLLIRQVKKCKKKCDVSNKYDLCFTKPPYYGLVDSPLCNGNIKCQQQADMQLGEMQSFLSHSKNNNLLNNEVIKNSEHFENYVSKVRLKMLFLNHIFMQGAQSCLIPKLLIILVIIGIFCCLLHCMQCLSDNYHLMTLETFEMVRESIDVTLKSVNYQSVIHASQLNNLTAVLYKAADSPEALFMAGVNQYFVGESKRLYINYWNDVCRFLPENNLNSVCSNKFTMPSLSSHIVPCKFLPIVPQSIQGYESDLLHLKSSWDVLPFLYRIWQITLMATFSFICAAGSSFLMDAVGKLLCQCLITCELLSEKKQRKNDCNKSNTVALLYSAESATNVPSEEETDENDLGLYDFSNRNGSANRSIRTMPDDSCEGSFKFTETKV